MIFSISSDRCRDRLPPTLLLIGSLAGCSATGALFERLATPPEGKGRVYVYRIGQVIGAVMPYKVKLDKSTEVSLPQGSWHRAELEPGTTVYIRVEAYIADVSGYNNTVGCKMRQVDFDQADSLVTLA
jgi:hypothetical protein